MTKRIFALLAALVLAVSMLNLSVFALDTTTGVITSNGITVTPLGYNSTYGSYVYNLTWTSTGAASYTISYAGGKYSVNVKNESNTYTAYLFPGITYYVWVYAGTTLVGTATIPAGATNTSGGTSYGLYYTNDGALSSGVYQYSFVWGSVSGASYYLLSVDGEVVKKLETNSYSTYFTSGRTYYVTVTAYDASGKSLGIIGETALVAGRSSSTSSATSGSVTTGNNCYVYSYDSCAIITWTAKSNAAYYDVYYYTDGSTKANKMRVYSATATLPVASTTGYTVYVFAYNSSGTSLGLTAYAAISAKATSSSASSSQTTEIKNLTISSSSSTSTTITWDKVSSAFYYIILYGTLGTSSGEQASSMTNSYTLPFGKNASYWAEVYAVTSSGKLSVVGSITYVPGSTSADSSTGSDSSTSTATSAYPTNFKGVSASGKVTLSWTAASGATSYTVYYKRSSSSTWLEVGTTSKKAVNVKGLNDGISYDFKVTASNGNDSGTVTITPSSTSKTVTAADPEGSATSSKYASLTSVSSSSTGTLSVSWTSVSGATGYKVYVAEGSSTTYKSQGTFTGTSATITGLTSGKTYKVRVVAIPYQTDLKTDLKACDYMSATVK